MSWRLMSNFEMRSPVSARNVIVEREPIVVLTPPNCRVPLLRGSWNPAASAALASRFDSERLPAAEDAQLTDEIEFSGDELPGPILER